MELQERFGMALKLVRKQRGLTQEDFSLVSSRTYLSTLERGLKSPTMEKIDQIASVLGIHPIVLFSLAYLPNSTSGIDGMCNQIRSEMISALHELK